LPIRWRLTLFIALVIGVILLALGLTLYLLIRGMLLKDVEATAKSRGEAVAHTIGAGDKLSTAPNDDDQILFDDSVAVIVRGKNGKVIDKFNLPAGGSAADFDVWRKALKNGQAASDKRVRLGDNDYYVYTVAMDPSTRPAQVVEFGKSYNETEEILEIFGTVLAFVIGAAFLLSIGGAYQLAGAALRPVDAVTGAASRMGEGDLSKRLPVANPKDELGRLVITINGLLSRLESAFVRREEALERQRRFAADASHELRTPLTAISGHARMLDEWALEGDPQRAKQSVGVIRREAGRMRRLAESLLALTRGDEGEELKIGRHDLAAVAEEAAQATRDANNGKVSIECVLPKGEVEATFDRDRAFQVASILLDNAVRYTPEGGNVTVGVREDGDWVALEVSDTGVGIPEDQLPLIFERFHRADPSRSEGGAGLGLSIARQIAEAHGGQIRAESTPGTGSTFTLLLPKRSRLSTPERPKEPAPSKRRRYFSSGRRNRNAPQREIRDGS
jgi:two-component system, OmpR family, sensor kinase